MLIAAVVCRRSAAALHAAAEAHTLTQVSNRDRDHQAILSDLVSLSRITVDAFILSADAGPQEALVAGLRQYRVNQPGTRIILLAPGREPGDPLVSVLVGLGVYDILSDEADELGSALASVLATPAATYAHAVRWHTPSVGLSDGIHQSPAPPQEVVRVMTSRDRPIWIAVTGATQAAGTTTLAWLLANELARKGLSVVLLADLSPQESEVVATALDPGLTVTLRSFALTESSSDRIATALEFGESADVVILDLGNLRKALDNDGQILAMANQLLISWPQALPRFVLGIQGFQALFKNQSQLLRHTLAKALHIPYLCRPQQTKDAVDLVASVLTDTVTGPHGPVVPVPLGADGPQLEELVSRLAPVSTQRRTLLDQIKRRWLPQVGGILLVSVLLWVLLGGLSLVGLPLPEWLSAIADTPAEMLRSILSVAH